MANRKPIRKKISVLVMGGSGMLGWMVQDYLASNSEFIVTSTLRDKLFKNKLRSNIKIFDVEEFLAKTQKYAWTKSYDYIINCIGVTKPYCKDDDAMGIERAIRINALFPHRLANFIGGSKPIIIQIATDCVYSGRTGKYTEDSIPDALDAYGKTKSLGEVFDHKNFLNIRCSIIGPEVHGHLSLLDWFLSQKSGANLTGFTHHKWNGVTTLQFAKICEKIMSQNAFKSIRKVNHTHHLVINNTVDKYRLLRLFSTHFRKKVIITATNKIGLPVYRDLSTKYNQLTKLIPKMTMNQAIKELADYMSGGRVV